MKVLDQRHLPEKRPATMDETGKRVYIFPAQVKGFFRRYRTILQVALVLFFLILPWIKIAGHQALLLDIAQRRFSIFGLTFWAHDGPLIFFLLAVLCLGLAFITAIWGRVWCGWGCPQTVFIDGVFRRIEYWILGSHIKQMNMARSPWSGSKLLKYGAVWTLFTVVSLIIAHSFLAYFVGAERLVDMTQNNPRENWTIFLIMAFVTAVVLFDFGWFREQFCIIVCPYGRFQSVLMDDDSMTVTYDYNRGEPRRGEAKEGEPEGDCINCFRCITVCPTGIDIRQGMQMECVGCTACIDVCDEVMDNVDKPKGLIRYATGKSLKGLTSSWFRPRVALYSLLFLVSISALVYTVSNRDEIVVTVLRARDNPYQVVGATEGTEEQVINHFKIHLKNQTFEDMDLMIKLPENWLKENVELVSQSNTLNIKAGENAVVHLFVKFPKAVLSTSGSATITLDVVNTADNKIEVNKEMKLVGPKSV